jgi:hypothetical protein
MAKKRFINTKFWQDNYISNLDPSEKLLSIYLLTNSSTNICGIYELPLKNVALETGLDIEMVFKILGRFNRDEKIYYLDGWVGIVNFAKHQAVNPSIIQGIERSLKEDIPEKVLANFKEKGIDWIQSVGRLSTESALPKPKLELKLNTPLTPQRGEQGSETSGSNSKKRKIKSVDEFDEQASDAYIEGLIEQPMKTNKNLSERIVGLFLKYRRELLENRLVGGREVRNNLKNAKLLASLNYEDNYYYDLFFFAEEQLKEISGKQIVRLPSLDTVLKFRKQFESQYKIDEIYKKII